MEGKMDRKWIVLVITVILLGVLIALSFSVLAAEDNTIIKMISGIKAESTSFFQEIFLPVVLDLPKKYP